MLTLEIFSWLHAAGRELFCAGEAPHLRQDLWGSQATLGGELRGPRLPRQIVSTIPPGTKPIHAGEFSWGINFSANTCGGLYSHSREYRRIFLRSNFPHISHIWGGVHVRCKYMPRLYSHPREYRKIFLGNYLCIGFVPGGIVCPPWEKDYGAT